jgi:hypothetical protein
VESYNIAVGATSELKQLVGGVTSASAYFSSLLVTRPKLLEDHYENVASLCQQRCGFSLELMRNVPLGFKGELQFIDGDDQPLQGSVDQPANFVKEIKVKHADGTTKKTKVCNVEKILINDISNPIVQDLVLDYTFNDQMEQTTASDAFADVKALLKEMKKYPEAPNPLILQFTMRDS